MMQIDYKTMNIWVPSWEHSGAVGAQRRPSESQAMEEVFLEEKTPKLTFKDKTALASQRKHESHAEGRACAKVHCVQ